MPNTANYKEQGGAADVIGGTQTVTGTQTVSGTLEVSGTAKLSGAVEMPAGVSLVGKLPMVVHANVTVAQINAGYTLVPAIAGKSVKVLNYYIKAAGSAAGATDIRLQDNNTSPVVVTTALAAALADAAEVNGWATVSNVTKGAGWLAALTAGKALQIVKTGSTLTGTTALDVVILFQYV